MQDERRIKISNALLLILGTLMVARFSCIALSNIPLMSMKFVFVYGVLFALLFFLGIRYLKKYEFVALAFLIIYLVEVVIITFWETGDLFNTQAFNAYIMFFLYLIYIFLKRIDQRKVGIVYGTAVLGFLFTYVYSIIQLIQNPLLSRMAATGSTTEENVDVLGAVGSFDTVYGSILVVCMLLFMIKQTNRVTVKIFSIVIMAICCVFLVMASYATALVLLILLFVLWIFQKNRWTGTAMVIIGIILFICREKVGVLISDFAEYVTYSNVLREKIEQIGTLLQTGETVGTWAGEEGRLARMGWSWNAFVEYPLFGGFGKNDVRIGEHSELFDALGRFGIIGAISLFTFLSMVFRDIYKGMWTKEGKKCCIICLILYGAMFVLNPALCTQQLLPIFVLLPLFDRKSCNGGRRT